MARQTHLEWDWLNTTFGFLELINKGNYLSQRDKCRLTQSTGRGTSVRKRTVVLGYSFRRGSNAYLRRNPLNKEEQR